MNGWFRLTYFGIPPMALFAADSVRHRFVEGIFVQGMVLLTADLAVLLVIGSGSKETRSLSSGPVSRVLNPRGS